jgi:transcriptional regulator with XRE-family HTH domain
VNKLGKNIDAFIKKKGLTLEDLAEKLGVSRMTLWRWCHAGARPSPLALKALRDAGVLVDEE